MVGRETFLEGISLEEASVLVNQSKRKDFKAMSVIVLGCALEKLWVCGAPAIFFLTSKSGDGLC